MAFCSKCGATLDPNSSFCASCGTPVSVESTPSTYSAPPPPVAPPPSSYTIPIQRPTGITILAILAGLSGLASIGFGLFFGPIGILVVIFGLIEFGVAYGFWTGAPWGWWFGIIGAVLNIISIASLNIVGFLIGLIMLYYLTRPNVKAWFHRI